MRVDPQKGFVTEYISAGPDQSGSWIPVIYDQWMPKQFSEKMWTVKQTKVGVWEAVNDQGMLMAIKQSGKGDFVSAPNGFMDVNGVWYRWDVNNHEVGKGVIEWNSGVKPEIQEIAKMVLESTRSEAVVGEASMWSAEFGNAGMDIKPDQKTELMMEFWKALFYSKTAPRDQWSKQGIRTDNLDDFVADIMATQSVNLEIPAPNSWGQNAKIKIFSGVDIRSIRIILATKKEYQSNPFVKSVVDTLTISGDFFTDRTDPTTYRYGFIEYQGRLVFVGSTIKGFAPDRDKSNLVGQLIDLNGQFNDEVGSAWYINTVRMVKELSKRVLDLGGRVTSGVDKLSIYQNSWSTFSEEYSIKYCIGSNCYYSGNWTKSSVGLFL